MKKGMNRTLNSLIIVMVTAILLFTFATPLFGKLSKDGDREGCKLSMLVRTGTTIDAGPVKVDSPISPSCPRYSLTFFDDKYELSKGTDTIEKKSVDELNDFIVNREIAEQLRDCWYQFGAGKIDTFWNPGWLVGDFNDDNRHCYICSEISFDNSVNQEVFTGFYEYLQDSTISGKHEAEGLKLYDYIANNGGYCQEDWFTGDNCWEAYAAEKNIDVKPEFKKDKKYAAVFIRHGEDRKATTLNAYIMLTSEMNKQCDTYVS